MSRPERVELLDKPEYRSLREAVHVLPTGDETAEEEMRSCENFVSMRRGWHDGGRNGHRQSTEGSEPAYESRSPMIHLPDGTVVEVGKGAPPGQDPGTHRKKLAKPSEFAKSWLDHKTPVEIIQNPDDPSGVLFAVRRAGRIEFLDFLEREGLRLAPPSRNTEPLNSMFLPSGVSAYDSSEKLAEACGGFLRRIFDLPTPEERVLASFILHTWIWDRLPLAICLLVFSSPHITDSLVRALALLCRRGVIVAGATATGILDACSNFDATLLVCQDSLNRAALEMLDSGSAQGQLHLQRGRMASAFGPKLIAASERRDELGRLRGGIPLPVCPSKFPRWRLLWNPEVLAQAEQLRRQLLQFRFDHADSVEIPVEAGTLRYPKRGLVTGALVAPFAANLELCREIAGYLEPMDDDRSERLPGDKGAVLSAVFHLTHDKKVLEEGGATVGAVAELANELLEARGERFKILPRKVGSVLTGLGLRDRPRSSNGYTILLQKHSIAQIHRLAKLYGVASPSPYDPWGPDPDCRMCWEIGLVRKPDMRPAGNDGKALEERRR